MPFEDAALRLVVDRDPGAKTRQGLTRGDRGEFGEERPQLGRGRCIHRWVRRQRIRARMMAPYRDLANASGPMAAFARFTL